VNDPVNDVDVEALIAEGIALETEATAEEAVAYFKALAQRYPHHARVQFEAGGAHDFAGYEAEAIPLYRRAIELGLGDDDLLKVTVQLGSSLRNVGAHDEAVATLRAGCERYPRHRALRAFYALALHSAGQQAAALAQMLHMTLDAPDFYERYTASLRYYAQDLTQNADQ
jgi:tetratricopeptide (TPR) repeat protein